MSTIDFRASLGGVAALIRISSERIGSGNTGDSVDNGDNYRRLVWCEHLRVDKNPLFSTTPNVAVGNIGTLYLVLEEGKVKLLCSICVMKAVQWG